MFKKLRKRLKLKRPLDPAWTTRLGVETDERFREIFDRGLRLDGNPVEGRRERFWTLIQFFESTHGLAGETAEAGCWRGLSSFLICSYRQLRDPSFRGAGHHVVDSFHGLSRLLPVDIGPSPHPGLAEVIARGGPEKESFRHLTERTLASFPDVQFHEGWIPEVLEKLAETRYRFVHIDVDIYEPTWACLDYFHPRMVAGGLIVIDDYGFPSWPGCKAAVDAWCAAHGESAVLLTTGNGLIIKREPRSE
jgi:hypothetical protein